MRSVSQSLLLKPRRLLLIACSARKLHVRGLMPALERYDGPAFRVVRRYLREALEPALDIWILSAEYGLISAAASIADYNRKMDRKRASELRAPCLAALRKIFYEKTHSAVLICMSNAYRTAVEGVEGLHSRITYAAPGQGPKLTSLKRWLWQDTKSVLTNPQMGVQCR